MEKSAWEIITQTAKAVNALAANSESARVDLVTFHNSVTNTSLLCYISTNADFTNISTIKRLVSFTEIPQNNNSNFGS